MERGIAINFGVAAEGQGVQSQNARQAQSPTKQNIPQPTPVNQSSAQPSTDQVEEVLTQAESEVVMKEAAKNPAPAGEEKARQETPVQEEEAKPEPPKPDAQTTSVLSKFIKGSKKQGEKPSGEGVSRGNEDQGSPDGNPYASTYYGTPTSGSGTSGYGLSGRSLRSRGTGGTRMQSGRSGGGQNYRRPKRKSDRCRSRGKRNNQFSLLPVGTRQSYRLSCTNGIRIQGPCPAGWIRGGEFQVGAVIRIFTYTPKIDLSS